jgi:hypothetical protein
MQIPAGEGTVGHCLLGDATPAAARSSGSRRMVVVVLLLLLLVLKVAMPLRCLNAS